MLPLTDSVMLTYIFLFFCVLNMPNYSPLAHQAVLFKCLHYQRSWPLFAHRAPLLFIHFFFLRFPRELLLWGQCQRSAPILFTLHSQSIPSMASEMLPSSLPSLWSGRPNLWPSDLLNMLLELQLRQICGGIRPERSEGSLTRPSAPKQEREKK